MKASLLLMALAALLLTYCGSSALAQDPRDPYPTMTAVHRYGHRKVAHAYHNVRYAGKHVRRWGHRKAHNVRAWLNTH